MPGHSSGGTWSLEFTSCAATKKTIICGSLGHRADPMPFFRLLLIGIGVQLFGLKFITGLGMEFYCF